MPSHQTSFVMEKFIDDYIGYIALYLSTMCVVWCSYVCVCHLCDWPQLPRCIHNCWKLDCFQFVTSHRR
jgi:hypothetical protein